MNIASVKPGVQLAAQIAIVSDLRFSAHPSMDQANEVITLSIEAHDRYKAAGKQDVPPLSTFDADVIREAAAMTEDIG